jgi:hypothetical protein
VIAGLLLALAAAGPVAPADSGSHQTVTLNWDAQTKACSARVGTIPVGDPATGDGAAALGAALSARQRAVQLQGLDGIPYACVDRTVSAIRKSGHEVKVGFLSEPEGQ